MPKYQFGCILEGLGMDNVGIFYIPLEHFTAHWYLLFMTVWYATYVAIWYIFPRFGKLNQEKSGSPALIRHKRIWP
jgi:hypothetical protein